jgi:predicted nucleotidyltransferase
MKRRDPKAPTQPATAYDADAAPTAVGQDGEETLLAEMVRRLVAELQPERIYLFGSRARRDADPDSDYDLLVVVPTSDLPPHRRDLLAFRALSGVGAPKDVLVLTHKEFESRARAASSLPSTVLREGKLLYAA